MQAPQMMIEHVRDEHFDDVARLYHSYREYFARDAADDASVSTTFLRERITKAECVLFVAVVDGRPVGFINLYPLWSSWYCRRIWFVSDLYVDEAARGHGAAAQLVERAKAFACDSGASSMMVELPKHEPHLYKFYANLGFIQDKTFDLARFECSV
jgi:GNAT superfamily N-acetyltransferase